MITQQELKDLLHYNPETGLFHWLIVGSGWRRDSNLAGSHKGQCVAIRIRGKMYKAHRLAWLYMTGSMPKGGMDHKNRDPLDNRFDNLREATISQNLMNRRSVRRKPGLKGTTFHEKWGLWNARVKKDGVQISLGYFKTTEEAHQAYRQAATRLHGEFAFTDY